MTDDTAHPDDDDRELLEVEALLRSLTEDDLAAPEPPPASVWAGIQAELAQVEQPTSLDAHRERRRAAGRPLLLAAAAAVVLVVGAVAVIATRGGDQEVVATAQLTWDAGAFDPLGRDATATAELIETDGGFELALTDASLPTGLSGGADLELWMIAPQPDGSLDVQPVSLVDASSPGTYRVPRELDPDTYSIVDISIEPRDGDPAHSGRSILRGQLQA